MSDISSINSTTNSYTNYSSNTSNSVSTPSAPASSAATGQLLRITGMNSGIDVDSTVNKLMTPYQQKIDNVKQDMQKIQWKQQMYENIINDVKTFQDTYFNSTDPTMNVSSSSFFNTIGVTSSSTAISATGNSSATVGNYSILVNALAASPTIEGTSLDTEAKITDFSSWSNGSLTFNVGGKSVQISLGTITPTGNNVNDTNALVSSINNAIASNSTLNGSLIASSVTDNTGTYIKFNNINSGSMQLTDSTISDLKPSGSLAFSNIISTGPNTTLSQLGFSGTTSLNLSYNSSSTPVSISVKDSETLDELTTDISNKTGGSVTGSFDDITGKFVLTSKVSGSQSTLSVTNSSPASDPLLKALGLSSSTLSAQGKDANITISNPSGTSETISEESNSFSINGLNLILNSTTAAGSPINVNVTSDPSAVFTKFKGFMDKYNSLVTEINTKVTEKVSSDYPPLTDAQKSSMSASDIQAWNTKAQVGLLHNDTDLSNLLESLKSSMYDAIQGTTVSFGSQNLGVDLSSDFSKDGTIVFSDQTGETFKKELQDHNEDVVNLFTKSASVNSTDSTNSDKYNNEGIFQRINDILINNTGTTGVTSTDSILGKMAYKQDSYSAYGGDGSNTFLDQIFQDNNQLTNLQSEYKDKQTAYYTEFSNLDQALSQLNNQSAVISQMLGSSN